MQDSQSHPALPAPLLDQATAAFIPRSVSIYIASRDAAMVPAIMRAPKLLANIRANGAIAVVFSQPGSHRTVQLKGSDASVLALTADDAVIIAAYADSFVADLCSISHTEAFARTIVSAAAENIVAITFSPAAAFDQTPGPNAGRVLSGSA